MHRGGSGSPLVLLHGFTDTWRTWDLVLPALERSHDVLAPTLAGHAGGPPLEGPDGEAAIGDAIEAAMDEAGFGTAHFAGNSLGGYVSTLEGRRRASLFTTTNFEHIPAELLAHQMRGAAACEAVEPLLAQAERQGWNLDAERIACPVRIVWGTDDKILEWPQAAVRYRTEWAPQADWVELDGIGHCPQLDAPAETADLILGFTHP